MSAWPAAYYQPDPKQDCQFYATAYVCRALGYSDVTAQDVMAFRHTPREVGGSPGRFLSEAHYPEMVWGLAIDAWWTDRDPHGRQNERWWLGPAQRAWVEQMLADGWIARLDVMRVTTMAHAVVLLESHGDTGALIMDPHKGLVVEPWAWLLAGGPGRDCHRIEAWYRRPA